MSELVDEGRDAVTSAPLMRYMSATNGSVTALCLRRKIPTSASQDGDINVIAGGDFTHQAAEAVIKVLGQSIELLGKVEGDDGYFALSN